jgi:hypothetical protein
LASVYDDFNNGGGPGSPSQSFRPLSAGETQKLKNVQIELSEDCANKKNRE